MPLYSLPATPHSLPVVRVPTREGRLFQLRDLPDRQATVTSSPIHIRGTFSKEILFIYLEGKGGRRGERNIDVREKHRPVAPRTCPVWGPGDQAQNPALGPDWAPPSASVPRSKQAS